MIMKRILAMVIAAAMALTLFSACGGGSSSAQTQADVTEDSGAQDAPGDTATPPPVETVDEADEKEADVVEDSGDTGSVSGPFGDLDPIELIWYFPGNWPCPDQEMVFTEINRMFQEYINTTVDFRPTSFGDFEQKMSLVISSGDEYDICFTSNWLNNYGINVGKGAFLDLTDLLPQYAPNTYASVTPAFWETTKVNGKIYAVVCEQISARISAVSIGKDDEEATGYYLEKDYVQGDLRSLVPYMEKIHEVSPNRYFGMALDVAQEFLGMEFLNGHLTPGGIDCFKGDTTVFNQFKAEGMLKWVEDMRYFNEMGFMDSARRITFPDDSVDEARARLGMVGIGGAYKPGGAEFDSMVYGYQITQVPSNKPILTTGGIIATMQALNRNTKNPERSMILLEVLNYNTEGAAFNRFYNTLTFGIQGVHWDTDGTFRIPTEAGAERYNTNTEWMFASNFQAIPLQGQPADVWEQTRVVNDTALVSPLCGFLFDVEPVKGEAGACSAVIQEYYRPISLGVITEEEYDEFLAKLDSAGAEIIIAEMQRQVDAWLADR